MTYLRTSTKSNNQVHLSLQADILPFLTSWRFKRDSEEVIMDGDIHEEVEWGGCELRRFET